MRKQWHNQKGFVLPLVLVGIALMTSGVFIFLAQQSAELKANVMNRDYQLCIFTAKNAMAVAQASLGEDPGYPGTTGLTEDENGGHYSIMITSLAENKRFFDIESHYKSFTKKFTGEFEIISDGNAIKKSEITLVKWIMVGP
ncbi:MAG: type IV pilus modification PilV family protein [Acetobacterium sp.]